MFTSVLYELATIMGIVPVAPFDSFEAQWERAPEAQDPTTMPVISRRKLAKAAAWVGLFYAVIGATLLKGFFSWIVAVMLMCPLTSSIFA
jgi:uncharacterized membrane protein YphA (DoxX/SURF4 family)